MYASICIYMYVHMSTVSIHIHTCIYHDRIATYSSNEIMWTTRKNKELRIVRRSGNGIEEGEGGESYVGGY